MAKSTSKTAAKKAAPKKAPKKTAKKATKKEVVKYSASDVALTNPQSKTLEMVGKNQDRIEARAMDMLKIANDSGERLIKLRDDITKKYGRVWKAWAQTPGNLPIGYEQATRYMKLAGATDVEFDSLTATSIEGAVKEIEYMRKPEKAEADAKRKAEKAAGVKPRKTATDGIISNATLDEVERCNSVQELRGLIKLCRSRIEELENLGESDEGEVIDGEAEEVDDSEDQDDIETALS